MSEPLFCGDCQAFDGEDTPADYKCRSCGFSQCSHHADSERTVMCCESRELWPVLDAGTLERSRHGALCLKSEWLAAPCECGADPATGEARKVGHERRGESGERGLHRPESRGPD